jgi:type IV pilus assembly protein PilA
MYCTTCGQQNPETGRFCNNCGQALNPAGTSAAGSVPPPPSLAPTTPTDPNAPTDGKAVASLILGILGMTFLSILAGIPAVILGHMSRANIKRSMGKLKGEGLALAGLIMGYISFLAIPFILIIAAIAIPNLLRSRIAANEASSVGSLRTINTAEVTYAATYNKGFSPDLKSLGGESPCSANETHACLIDSIMSNGYKSGYRYSYQAFDSDDDGTMDKYFVSASPAAQGSSGRSTYCSSDDGIIRKEADGRECTADSPPMM